LLLMVIAINLISPMPRKWYFYATIPYLKPS
jgi:hypothetical protein